VPLRHPLGCLVEGVTALLGLGLERGQLGLQLGNPGGPAVGLSQG
jgi:hypothetical protein